MSRLPVAILGATGTVGQKFVSLLANHPWFEIIQLSASTERVGKRYGDVVHWRETSPVPDAAADILMTEATPQGDAVIAFSALDTAIARELEPRFAAAGTLVVSNAGAFRMEDDVPLLIPEVNADHLALLDRQRSERRWSGGIITNPNCVVAAVASALAPLHRAFGLESAVIATLQAASGAGYPGVPSLDLLGNVIPWIGGNEEEKIANETVKILGHLEGSRVINSGASLSAMVHRVPVVDGHLASIAASFGIGPAPEQAAAQLEAYTIPELVAGLPSAPAHFLELERRVDRPQTRLDRDRGNGMTVTVGRVRTCKVQQLRLSVLGHNLLRGAAGAAVLNAELAVAAGAVPGR